VTGLVEDDVDHQPVVEVGLVDHVDTGQRADGAVGAVAADDVAGADVAALAPHDDARLLLDEVGDRPAPPDLDAWDLVDPGEHRRFQLRLGEHQREGPARGAVAPPAEPDEDLAVGVAELVDLGRLGELQAPLGHAARLEDARRLVVVVHGAGQRVRLGVALEHYDPVTLLAEQDGKGRPDGAVPDDGDVVGLVFVHVFPPPARQRHTRRGARSPFSY
jgi:hypothetical protein